MMGLFFSRHSKLSITVVVCSLLLLVLLTYPTAYCVIYFDLAELPDEVSYNGTLSLGNQRDADKLIELLETINEEVVGHERAHRKAYGQWAGKSYFYTFNAKGQDYALAGCTPFKIGTPLSVLHKAMLAPMKPTAADVFVAGYIKSVMLAVDMNLADAGLEFVSAFFLMLKHIGPILLVFASFAFCLFMLFRSFL